MAYFRDSGLGVMALCLAAIAAPAAAAADKAPVVPTATADGVLKLKSTHDFDETLQRLQADVAAKGIKLFDVIDQQKLGADAQIPLRRSTLVLFGNPPLGVQFLTANPVSGLDWPVRMLVIEDADGSVWVAWNDFAWIARRYGITNRGPQFKMATEVAGSVATAATN